MTNDKLFTNRNKQDVRTRCRAYAGNGGRLTGRPAGGHRRYLALSGLARRRDSGGVVSGKTSGAASRGAAVPTAGAGFRVRLRRGSGAGSTASIRQSGRSRRPICGAAEISAAISGSHSRACNWLPKTATSGTSRRSQAKPRGSSGPAGDAAGREATPLAGAGRRSAEVCPARSVPEPTRAATAANRPRCGRASGRSAGSAARPAADGSRQRFAAARR